MYAKQTTRSRRGTHQVQDLACLDRSDRIMDRYDSHQVVAIGKRSACIIMTTGHVRVAPEKDIGETIHKRDQHASTIHCIIGTASGAEHP